MRNSEKSKQEEVKIVIADIDEETGEPYRFSEGADPEIAGEKFTSVTYTANNYGGASPCINNEEVKSAIEVAKRNIRKHMGWPIVVDKRKKAKLNKWIK